MTQPNPLFRERALQIVRTTLWGLLIMALVEAVIAWRFRTPASQPLSHANPITNYFEYGRSIEGKLVRMIKDSREASNPLIATAWLEPLSSKAIAVDGKKNVALFGMSFGEHILEAMVREDPSWSTSGMSGPSAPANFTYAAFEKAVGASNSDVFVWAILASSVPKMLSLTGQTTGFEVPAAFTYPRYVVDSGELRSVVPLIQSEAELRRAFGGWTHGDPTAWTKWVDQLKEHDAYYDSFLFREGWWDELATVRLVRRAWARSKVEDADKLTFDGEHFHGEAVTTLRLLGRRFHEAVQRKGKIGVIVLIHDHGFGTALYDSVAPSWQKLNIPIFSTHKLIPPQDRLQFKTDGHIKDEGNRRLGHAFAQKLKALGADISPKDE